MTHDFAKIRPEPLLEKRPAQTPPAWSMMITGIVVGMALGVFASVLLYLSGNVPPLVADNAPARPASNFTQPAAAEAQLLAAVDEGVATPDGVELEFYTVLRDYEVEVDATPVEIDEQRATRILDVPYMLQSGAFQDAQRAQTEAQRQQALGLDVRVQAEQLSGRTMYLVQSGPYNTLGQLESTETTLRRNAIKFLRTLGE